MTLDPAVVPDDPADLDAFITAVREIVAARRRTLRGPDSDWLPMFAFSGPSGLTAVIIDPRLAADPDARDVLGVEMAALAGLNAATMCGYALTSWMLVGVTAKSGLLPSQHPDRMEAVSLTAGAARADGGDPEIRLSYAQIARHAGRLPDLRPWVDLPKGAGQGRIYESIMTALGVSSLHEELMSLSRGLGLSQAQVARQVRYAVAAVAGVDPRRLPEHAPVEALDLGELGLSKSRLS